MAARRLLSLASGVALVTSLTGFGAAAIPAAAEAIGAVTPQVQVARTHFGSAPTTSQCQQFAGIACYSPQQIQSAYDMAPLYGAGLTGTGKTIVLVDSFGSPTIAADLKAFDKAFNLPAPPKFSVLQPVGPIPPFNPRNATRVGWAEETTLDVEYSHAMAPGANILLVETPVAETEGINGIPEIVHAENYVIKHHLGDVISQSFGATEPTFLTPRQLLDQRSAFRNAAQSGVTVLGSSGDAGTTDYKDTAGTLLYEHRVNSWPSSDPLVTSIGGTQLHLNDAGDRTEADNVWNDTNIFGSPAAGGGGVSSVFARPAYQNGVSSAVGTHRGTPDVSLSAAVDGGVLVYFSFIPPGFYIIGGTSEASPLFSGIVAIADQAAGRDLGLLNPTLYALGAAHAAGIVDITIGNNTVSFIQGGRDVTVPGYTAKPGYDLSSGLGTVDGAALVSELSAG